MLAIAGGIILAILVLPLAAAFAESAIYIAGAVILFIIFFAIKDFIHFLIIPFLIYYSPLIYECLHEYWKNLDAKQKKIYIYIGFIFSVIIFHNYIDSKITKIQKDFAKVTKITELNNKNLVNFIQTQQNIKQNIATYNQENNNDDYNYNNEQITELATTDFDNEEYKKIQLEFMEQEVETDFDKLVENNLEIVKYNNEVAKKEIEKKEAINKLSKLNYINNIKGRIYQNLQHSFDINNYENVNLSPTNSVIYKVEINANKEISNVKLTSGSSGNPGLDNAVLDKIFIIKFPNYDNDKSDENYNIEFEITIQTNSLFQ